MSRFLPIVLVACTLGCQTFAGRNKATSGWYALEKAEAVKCSSWPLRERDLQLDELAFIRAPRPGFLATGLKRDASPLTYYTPFKGSSQIDADDFAAFDLGRQAVILGAASTGQQTAVIVARNSAAKATLEVRALQNNVVKAKAELGGFNVVDGWTAVSQGGVYVAYKSEDNLYHLAFLATRGGKLALHIVDVTYKDRPAVLTLPSRPGALVVWKEGETGRPFRVAAAPEDGTIGAPMTLDIDVVSQTESWSATAQPGHDYLAFVDGDSLIGQAELKIAAFAWGDGAPHVQGTRTAPLKDVHVTEPVFLAGGKGLEVLLLNWIDEESTIARYMVAGSTLGKPVYSGVYPKGTRIVEAFTGDSPDDLYVLTRNRDDNRWAFQVCEL